MPLPLHRGSTDERVGAVLAWTPPVGRSHTTSAVAGTSALPPISPRMHTAPKIVEIDSLDPGRRGADRASRPPTGPASPTWQHSLGFDPTPTGVMLSHLQPQGEPRTADAQASSPTRHDDPRRRHDRLWLPASPRHGSGARRLRRSWAATAPRLTSPVAFLERPARWVRSLARNPHAWSSAPNFAFRPGPARPPTAATWPGWTSAGARHHQRRRTVEPATLQRFVDRFAHFNFADRGNDASVPRPGGRRRSSWRRAPEEPSPAGSASGHRRRTGRGPVRRCLRPGPARAAGKSTVLSSSTVPQSPALPDRRPRDGPGVARTTWSVRCWCTAITSPRATGANRRRSRPVSARRSSTRRRARRPDPWLKTGDLAVSSPTEACSSSAASGTCSSSAAATTIPKTSRPPSRRSPVAGSRPYRCR